MTKAAYPQTTDARAGDTQPTTWVDYMPASFLAFSGMIGLAYAGMATLPDNGQYLVIAPPGSSLADTINIVQAAGGGLIEKGLLSNIVIAGSSHVDFESDVRRTGAWLAVAAPSRSGCFTTLSQEMGR